MSYLPPIPSFSVAAANAGLDIVKPIRRVLDRNWYVLGEEVAGFEREFSLYVGAAECVGVANGTDALELALRGLEIEVGDRVAAVANAGFYSSTAIRAVGGVPLYVDVDESTLTMSPHALRNAMKLKPRAIIVTHLYGQMADVAELCRVAAEFGIPLIEDCAQSHGAIRDGKQAGSHGRIGCFSFYPTKNLGALGDGGAIVTSDAELAGRVRQLRQYGWSRKYEVERPGGRNSRLDEVQAAVLREKLPHLFGWNEERRRIARKYNAAFSSLPLMCPSSVEEDYAAHLYVVRVRDRERFRAFLATQGIPTDVHYPVPDHKQAAYPSTEWALPVTEAACASVVSLPCYPGMTDADVNRVIAAVVEYFLQ